MSEWSKEHAWKACVRSPHQGFESLPHRKSKSKQAQCLLLFWSVRRDSKDGGATFRTSEELKRARRVRAGSA